MIFSVHIFFFFIWGYFGIKFMGIKSKDLRKNRFFRNWFVFCPAVKYYCEERKPLKTWSSVVNFHSGTCCSFFYHYYIDSTSGWRNDIQLKYILIQIAYKKIDGADKLTIIKFWRGKHDKQFGMKSLEDTKLEKLRLKIHISKNKKIF